MFKLNTFIVLLFSQMALSSHLMAQGTDTTFLKGKSEFEIGNYAKAFNYFAEIISVEKNYKSANYLAGMAKYNLKEYKSAKKYFKKETKINPKNVNAFLFKAKSKENIGRNKSALKDIKKALAVDSTSIVVLIEKANILLNQKKYDKAIQSYLYASKLSPKTEFIYYKLGFCEYYLNQPEKACEYWGKLEDVDDFENYETIIKTCNLKH